jgi:hypothetical protein
LQCLSVPLHYFRHPLHTIHSHTYTQHTRADAGNAAFSAGFGWANFDLLPSGKQEGGRRASEPSGNDPRSCDINADGSYVVAFFKRSVTCAAILIGIFVARECIRLLQMRWYPGKISSLLQLCCSFTALSIKLSAFGPYMLPKPSILLQPIILTLSLASPAYYRLTTATRYGFPWMGRTR